ncbi:hypothetical protein S40285_08571 [Stachybotrys chlorohalonatus IBT 40285]|uniref:Uncharacterized protein n=1 Tax=Stachybotrys chlorohalonatus (strain IBT 40285) TaxID=1283841 RepID=A0A084QAY2_STAC4|nr:hypothetical protein S40285_08571 [Stachybotrys chlorohalonata IBT 40285]
MAITEVQVTLAPFDHCVPRAYYNGAIYVPLKSGVTPTQAFDLLHEGLRRTFVALPWLNGHVRFQSPEAPGWRPGQLELRYRAVEADGPRPAQLKFKELETDLDFDSLRELGFPLDAFRDADIAPAGFFADPKSHPDVFVGQANFLPGGCIVVSAIHHAASDETAFFHVLRLWADHCTVLQAGGPPPVDFPTGSDSREILRDIWARESLVTDVDEIDPETWRLVGLLPTDVEAKHAFPPPTSAPPPKPKESGRVLKAGVFYLSPARLAELRAAIANELGVSSGISANDAVCALIWRCFLRVRVAVRRARKAQTNEEGNEYDHEEAKSGLNMVCDGRANYSSTLPQTYLGNITFNVQSSLQLQKLIAPEPGGTLGVVAATLRRNAGRIDSENLQNLYNLLDHLPSYDELIRLKRMRTSSIDGNNMSISSLINVQIDSVCFGDGPVFGNKGYIESSRLLMEANNSFTRTCIVLPRNKSGGVEFLASLYDDELDLLMADKEFGQQVLCMCWPEI